MPTTAHEPGTGSSRSCTDSPVTQPLPEPVDRVSGFLREAGAEHAPPGTAFSIGNPNPISRAVAVRLRRQNIGTFPTFVRVRPIRAVRGLRGVNERRVLADLVSLVRHAVLTEDELVPYPEQVAKRYKEWIAAQEVTGRAFMPAQRWWLDSIAAHIGVNLSISPDDLNASPFFERGGQLAAAKAFGNELPALLDELNEALSE